MRVHDILPRQQEASGENGQNCRGHERKGGHSELVACGWGMSGGAKVPAQSSARFAAQGSCAAKKPFAGQGFIRCLFVFYRCS